jgi:hypothetical protein
MLNVLPLQATWLRRQGWALVNLIVLPPVGMAALLILVFTYWVGSPAVFQLRASLALLPWAMLLGAGLGLALGLLQALALRGRVALLRWTLATGAGLAVSGGLVFVGWVLRLWSEQPLAVSQLSAWGDSLAQGGFWLLALGHGCALAAAQGWALGSGQLPVNGPSRRAWLWGAGLTWSLLTPFAYILTEAWWQALALALPLPVDFGGLYLPFLLFSLPYVIVTTRLWRSV